MGQIPWNQPQKQFWPFSVSPIELLKAQELDSNAFTEEQVDVEGALEHLDRIYFHPVWLGLGFVFFFVKNSGKIMKRWEKLQQTRNFVPCGKKG